jgi:diacylglycerol O-acyltransferase
VRVVLPSPGSMRQLRDFVGAFGPLWKAALVEGLENDKLSLVMKVHHAAMDGGRAVAIAGELLDDREPSIPWLAADTLRTLVGKPKRAIAATRRVASGFRARGSSAPQASPETALPEKAPLFEAPATPFNRALTPNRSVGLSEVSFEDVKAIKEAFATTVNDVVLAACCASLRSWLAAHGGLPERPLIATVPVSVRHEGDEAGNRVSVIRVHLPWTSTIR